MSNAQRVAQAVLRAFFDDPEGFRDMERDERLRRATRAAGRNLPTLPEIAVRLPWWRRAWLRVCQKSRYFFH